MRGDLQAILNAPANAGTYPVSRGQPDQDTLCVLAWLYMKLWAPNINFNIPTLANKVAGLQGVTQDMMWDFQIEALATYFGYGNYTWPQLLAVAKGAINGQGIQQLGVENQVAITSPDYQTLMNYALLTATKVLNDAS